MPTNQEILDIAQPHIETTVIAQRRASRVALREMNAVADGLTHNDLFAPRDPFVFAMTGESSSMDEQISQGYHLISTAAAQFPHRKQHTIFANNFPLGMLHAFDEASANEYKTDPALDQAELQSAVRYLITKEAGIYWGRLIVPTLAVVNFSNVLKGVSPEVERAEFTVLALSRRPKSMTFDIEHVGRPKYLDELDHDMRMSGAYPEEDIADAFIRAKEAIQSHPDYQIS